MLITKVFKCVFYKYTYKIDKKNYRINFGNFVIVNFDDITE